MEEIFNKKNIKTWSIIGSRATFGLFSLDLVKKEKDIIIVTADVSTSAGLDKFRKNFPNNFVDVGISEQNMIGVATGLTRMNYKVITTTFSPFQTLRCCEQIKVNMGYMKDKITMVGLASGLILGPLGFTHCSIEDIGVLRSIPNLSIISPADSLETAKSILASLNYKDSVYIRLTGGTPNPSIYENDYTFEIGKGIVINRGNKIAIITNGAMVYNCIKASEILKKNNINPTIINMHTVKPLDEHIIIKESKNFDFIFTVEEHNIIGGLGSAVSEAMTKNNLKAKLVRLGIYDNYPKAGSYNHLKKKLNLDAEGISKSILNKIKDVI